MQEKSMNEWSELFGLPYEIAWLGPPKWKVTSNPFRTFNPTHLMKLLGQVYHMKLHPSNLLRTSNSIWPRLIQVNKWVCVCVCVFLSFFLSATKLGVALFSVLSCKWMQLECGHDGPSWPWPVPSPVPHFFFQKNLSPTMSGQTGFVVRLVVHQTQ